MKVYIETYGCSANYNDSEILAGIASKKHKIANGIEEADAIIVNTCSVKGRTESRIRFRLSRISALFPGKRLVIAGCMAEAQKQMLKKLFPNAAFLGPHKLDRVIDVLSGENDATGYADICKPSLPKLSRSKIISIVQINDGCANFCTYCITKLAKPRLVSYPAAEIAKQVQAAVDNGFKEVWLTSQDTAAYGLDIGTNLAKLLKEILKIKGDYKLRIGMMNPQLVKPFLSELISAYKDEHVYKFLHMPFQAASNEVLKHMRRGYTIQQFKAIIAKFRRNIPKITVATDVICGYPTETEKQFDESIKLVKEIKPDVLNISRFWSRPGTEAALLKQLPGDVLKDRTVRMTALARKISAEKNKKWLGWKGSVLMDELGKGNSLIGRNFAYKQAVLKGASSLLGKRMEVEIVASTSNDLRARRI
ncbi:MAG: tRNA (N(6)-L-threonylcarbamoyladenosine(37)-C(2))-methylthiotransferase [Candidatus Woesearchaeota archaeon]